MRFKLQNNRAWVLDEERRIAESDDPDRMVLFVLLTTDRGGNEYRPVRRMAEKRQGLSPDARFFVKRRPGIRTEYIEIDLVENQVDLAGGTVHMPVTPMKVQMGAFPYGSPTPHEPLVVHRCPVCGREEYRCGCADHAGDEDSPGKDSPGEKEYV